MTVREYGITDFHYVAAGAAILASGGGGSYCDAVNVLEELAATGWKGSIPVRNYDGKTNCCVLALMGSPDAAVSMTLADVENSIANTVGTIELATGATLGCVIPVEIGAINSIVPLLAATKSDNAIQWVVDGDGAGRAVPELPQTTYSGSASLAAGPCSLANDAEPTEKMQSATLNAETAALIESLAGGIVSAFGSFSGIALWPSNPSNGFALTGNYLAGTLSQTWALGKFLLTSATPPSTASVALQIMKLTGRAASPIVTNFFITAVTQSTTSGSLDTGIIRLDNSPDQTNSTETHTLYILNESLILYSSLSSVPDIIAPDSICYYSESNGRGFSNAIDDLTGYFNPGTGKSTGRPVSVIKVDAAPELCRATGVVASFAALLQNIGYAGALPYPD
ncbi:MAG: DUF917 domain-containing protein [Proteobacteria bacterium]|nr:DUF917 domain-containing protein [Pseudomonadota bacterium]